MTQTIGILTAGGDSPGLNAAIRAVGKAARRMYDIEAIGFMDGFRGLMENRVMRLDEAALSGILTKGGTILGTSRDKPHRMELGGKTMDMTDLILENFSRHELRALVCMGGGGTQKNALRLKNKGMNIVTLPKTIDNDVAMTDRSFGFDTALGIATEAIDRLHSTAHSHHRIIVVEVMGHNTGWLALAAGIAGGADVILIPEIPYDVESVAATILRRKARGSRFSIVAVSEGALSVADATTRDELVAAKRGAAGDEERLQASKRLSKFEEDQKVSTLHLSTTLESLTGLESRVTILGHVQRGGTPSPVDRLLATRLGTEAARAVHEEEYGVMIASRGHDIVRVPLEDVAGKRRIVTLDHPWVLTARRTGVGLGDEPPEG